MAPILALALVLQDAQEIGRVLGALREAMQAPDRPDGDALFDHYVRAALAAATGSDRFEREPAATVRDAILALSYFLDRDDVLARNPFTRTIFGGLETDQDRAARLRRLGSPTLRGRGDWAAHFTLSCALALTAGAQMAERLGIQKELSDARPGGSGFSMADLLADFAGIRWAAGVGEEGFARCLAAGATGFRAVGFFPEANDLPEGLTREEFDRRYGGVDDERFVEECRRLRERIAACPGYGADGGSADPLPRALALFLSARPGSQEEEAALAEIETIGASRADLGALLAQAMLEERGPPLEPGIHHGYEFEALGVTIRASIHVPARLGSAVPLWLIPAHPSHTPDDDETFEFMAGALPQDGLLMWVHLYNEAAANPDGPVAARFGSGAPEDRRRVLEHGEVYAAAVAMAIRRFPVDPDRVYAWGVSASGNATWWIGVRLPDVLAGLCACDTNPEQVIPWLGALQSVRVAILHGERDELCPVRVPRRVDAELAGLRVERRFLEVPGAGHGQTWRTRGPELYAWLSERRRRARPDRVRFFPERPGDRSFWIEARALAIPDPSERPLWGEPPAEISAQVRAGGTVQVGAPRRVREVRLWFDGPPESWESPWIVVNGRTVRARAVRRLAEALRYCKGRWDPGLFAPWAVDLEIR